MSDLHACRYRKSESGHTYRVGVAHTEQAVGSHAILDASGHRDKVVAVSVVTTVLDLTARMLKEASNAQ